MNFFKRFLVYFSLFTGSVLVFGICNIIMTYTARPLYDVASFDYRAPMYVMMFLSALLAWLEMEDEKENQSS